MAGVASGGRLAAFMTVYTPLHPDRLLRLHACLQCNVAMTALALQLGGEMPGVAEEHKIGHFVDAPRRYCALAHFDVAYPALLHRGEPREIPAGGPLVAGNARLFQRCVLLMIERGLFTRRGKP